MNLLPYFQLFLDFLLDEFWNGLWIAGIGFAGIFWLMKLTTRKRWFRV